MIEKIREIIMEQLDVESSEINENTRIIEDLGADSLDVVEILSAIENEYGFEIQKEEMKKIHTIKDIMEYVEKNR